MKINMPKNVQVILNTLKENGFKAYIVGGCVRDSLLGKEPKDWDMTTNATPTEIVKLFPHINPTGLKHGTVTIIIDGEGYETTTFRTEGAYSDGRRPDSVEFCQDLMQDLSRRDFTINAMAYNDEEGLIDYFNGREDLENGYIRCVGNPYERFEEDGLRILRAFRFRATLGFTFDGDTWHAIEDCTVFLEFISKERVRDELTKIIMSNHRILRDMITTGVMQEIIPDFSGLARLNVESHEEEYKLFEHTLITMKNIDSDLSLKLAMLLHGIGKLHCKTIKEDGSYEFYPCYRISRLIAEKILTDLRFENKVRDRVTTLIEYLDYDFADSKAIKRCLGRIGIENTKLLIKVKWAEVLSNDFERIKSDIVKLVAVEKMMNNIIATNECYSLKQLHINGNDLIGLGFHGKEVGEVLNILLEKVIDNKEYNHKLALIVLANRIYRERQK